MYTTRRDFYQAQVGHDIRSYQDAVGIHPTRSIETLSHLVMRPNLFRPLQKKRLLSYEASTDPAEGDLRDAPTTSCPHCTEKVNTAHGLRLHILYVHPALAPATGHTPQVSGVKSTTSKRGYLFARPPQRNQGAPWAAIKSHICPECRLKGKSVGACRRHWSNACSNPLVTTCPGCQLVMTTASKASCSQGDKTRPHTPLKVRAEARALHNCNKDPSKTPLIARRSLARAGIGKNPAPAASRVPQAGRPFHCQLLPPVTVRRFLRPRVKIRERSLFAHPHRCLRKETYKPLPAGSEWPPLHLESGLPHVRRKNKKKLIPLEVLAEWRRSREKKHGWAPPEDPPSVLMTWTPGDLSRMTPPYSKNPQNPHSITIPQRERPRLRKYNKD